MVEAISKVELVDNVFIIQLADGGASAMYIQQLCQLSAHQGDARLHLFEFLFCEVILAERQET